MGFSNSYCNQKNFTDADQGVKTFESAVEEMFC